MHMDTQDNKQPAGKGEGGNDRLAGLAHGDYQARRRHAYGLVRLMKSLRLILPLIVIALLALIYNFAEFRSTAPPAKTAAKSDKDDESSTNALIDPRFESEDAEGRPFTITADKAFHPGDDNDAQSVSMGITGADEIHLQSPLADIGLEEGTWLAIEADRGIYRRAAEKLALHDNVRIFHDSGYELNTSELYVDIAATTARNDLAVTVTGPKGKIEAEGLRADKKAGTLVFQGPARLEMQSDVALP